MVKQQSARRTKNMIAILDENLKTAGIEVEADFTTESSQFTGWEGSYTVIYADGKRVNHTGEFRFEEEIYDEDGEEIGTVTFVHEPEITANAKSQLWEDLQQFNEVLSENEKYSLKQYAEHCASEDPTFMDWLFGGGESYSDFPAQVQSIADEMYNEFLSELNSYEKHKKSQLV
jgi:hypothetical protein